MIVRALRLQEEYYGRQWFDECEDRWEYNDFKADPRWRKGWISFDCALYNPDDDRVYLGITSFDADIFRAYDRKSGRFIDLGFSGVADPFDAKFHRSLAQDINGYIYGAVALLHDVDNFWNAPGGAVVKHDPETGTIEKLGIPLPNIYIQSIALDDDLDTLYCLCFAPEHLASFNLKTGEVKNLGLIGTGYGGMAQGENIVLDKDGSVWSSWSLTRAWQSSPGADSIRLCKYDPGKERIVFYDTGLPMPDGSHGYAKPEAFFNLGDGLIYASGANGSLYRIDPESADAEYLFTPTPDRRSRLSSLANTEDGIAYGVTGRDGRCELMKVNYREGKFEKLGEIRDGDEVMWQCHDIVIAGDGTLYACENDNPYRSSYLWEIEL